MHNPGFQDDYSLVTFSRLRYPQENYNKLELSMLLIFIPTYLALFVPYFYFLVILYIQIRAYPLSSLELSTSLLLLSHILFYLLLLVSHRTIPLFMIQVYQSGRYLQTRGFDYAYKAKYYIIIFSLLLFIFLPYFLIVLFSDSQFISEQFKNVHNSLTLPLVATLTGFPITSLILNYAHTSRSFNTHAHSYFTHKGVEIKGKRTRMEFRMFYSLAEISSFVLLYIPNTLDFEKEDLLSIPPEDFALLYILDKLGNVHICSYYIQGSQLIQDVYSFLSKQYSDIEIEILIPEDSSDLNPFFLFEDRSNRKTRKNLRFLLETAFVPYFFYPYMVIPGERDTSKYLPDPSPFRNRQLPPTDSKILTESLTFKSIRERYNSEQDIGFDYIFVILLSVITMIPCGVVLGFSSSRFFGENRFIGIMLISFLLLFYICPAKKWNHLGLQSVPNSLLIVLTVLTVIG